MKTRAITLLAVLAIVTGCDGEGRGTVGISESTLPASKLTMQVQPTDVVINTPITPAIVIAIQTATGTTKTTSSAVVTLALTQGAGPNGALATGTVTSTAVNGIATFNNVRVNTAGAGFKLTATSSGLAAATTSAFTVNP